MIILETDVTLELIVLDHAVSQLLSQSTFSLKLSLLLNNYIS